MCKRMQYIAMFIRKPGLVRGLKFTQYTDTGARLICANLHTTPQCVSIHWELAREVQPYTRHHTAGGAVAHW